MLPSRSEPPADILTFDIEDWFHILGVPELEDTRSWAGRPSIVVRETDRIIEALDRHGVKATFFIVGWIAERYPKLVRRLADQGHELASHSYWHRPVFRLTREDFAEDLRRSIAVVEDAAGAPVRGFRAPSFSVTPGHEWAFDVIVEAGLSYDASLFPIARQNGGYPCVRAPHMREAPSGGAFAELPMSYMTIGPLPFAFSGGGYFRLAPAALIARGFKENRSSGAPTIVYLHPRDFTADWPLDALTLPKRVLARLGCERSDAKLDQLLRSQRFSTCMEFIEATFGAPGAVGGGPPHDRGAG